MDFILTLLLAGLAITLLDVDNALYMTSVVDQLKPQQQQKAIFFGLLIELAGRLFLLFFFFNILSGDQTLFTLFGIDFSIETISLLIAGLFLFVRSSKDLIEFFKERGEQKEDYNIKQLPYRQLMIEMSFVNILLSIDTVVAVGGMAQELWFIVYVLTFSGVVRLLFVREIARFIRKYPAMNIVAQVFLIMIGLELIAQAMGLDAEPVFNAALLGAGVIIAIVYHWRSKRAAASA